MADLVSPTPDISLLSVSIDPALCTGGVATIALAGELDRSNEHEARLAIERLLSTGITCLVVDLSRLRFMDSSGINVLIRAYNALMQRHGNLVLVSPAGPVYRILDVVCINRIVPIYPSVQHALSEVLSARPAAVPQARRAA